MTFVIKMSLALLAHLSQKMIWSVVWLLTKAFGFETEMYGSSFATVIKKKKKKTADPLFHSFSTNSQLLKTRTGVHPGQSLFDCRANSNTYILAGININLFIHYWQFRFTNSQFHTVHLFGQW